MEPDTQITGKEIEVKRLSDLVNFIPNRIS